jgi:hypothetical protein
MKTTKLDERIEKALLAKQEAEAEFAKAKDRLRDKEVYYYALCDAKQAILSDNKGASNE